METLVHQSDLQLDLQDLGHTLQAFFKDFPIRVQCAVRDERLIVLGQHPECSSLDPAHILKILERKIQSFQLDFTNQVRLYLRVIGHPQPYAHRWFMIQPPPPRMLPCAGSTLSTGHDDEPWVIEEDELDALVYQLTASHPLDDPLAIAPLPALEMLQRHAAQSPSDAPTQSTSEKPSQLALPNLKTLARQSIQEGTTLGRSLQHQVQAPIQLLSRTLLNQHSTTDAAVLKPDSPGGFDRRIAIATGATLLGIAGATYTLTRPCVVGSCPVLSTAQTLNTTALQIMLEGEQWHDLEIAQDKLTEAIQLLDPIPGWSRYADDAEQLVAAYQDHLDDIERVLAMEEMAFTASKAEQGDIRTIAELEAVRSLWQNVMATLVSIPTTSHLYPLTLKHLGDYRDRLTQVEQRLQVETQAMQALENAKQVAQLAQTRQSMARSLENWQFARVTWIVALERLESVPQHTIAEADAQRLIDSYQVALDVVNERVQREQAAVRILEQAEQRAQIAQAAEQRMDWHQAVDDWDRAIAYAEQVETDTHYKLAAEELITHYTHSLNHAQEKLEASEQIEAELDKTCIGEIRICTLLSVGQTINVRLHDGYVTAINAARNTGNEQLQAVVTDHQLTLRRTLEQVARTYQLPVEVYDNQNRLLERHMPR